MKTISRNLHSIFFLIALLLGWFPVCGAEIRKANNGDPMDQGSSWIGGIAPTNTDVAVWDSVSGSPSSPLLDLNWQGIRLLETPFLGTLTIPGPAYTLTLGDAGIDMSAADANLEFYFGFLSLDANQVWNIGPGRMVTVFPENGPGTGALYKIGPGTLKLYYSTAASHLSDTAALGLAGGTVQLEGASYAEVVGSALVYGDATRVMSSGQTLVLNNITRSVGGTVDFAQAGIAYTTSGNDGSENGGILGGWATVNGEFWAQATPGGGNQPIQDYSFLAQTDFYETNNVCLQAATFLLPDSRAFNSLRFQNDAALDIGPLSFTNISGGILMGSASFQAGIVGSGTMYSSAGEDLIFHTPYPVQLLSNLVIIAGSGGLTKTGPGTLLLNQANHNTYTGPTTINGGTLQTGNANGRRYVSTMLRINHDGAYLHGTGDNNLTLTHININGGMLNLAGRADFCPSLILGYNGNIVGFSPVRTFTVGNTSTPVDARWGQIDVRLLAPGGLTKTTDRKVVIARTNTLVGATRIENGALQITGNSTVGAGSLIIGTTTNNAKLILGGTNGVGTDFSGAITITNLDVLNPGPLIGNAVVGGSALSGDNRLILNFGYDTNFNLMNLGGFDPYENSVGLTKTGAGTLSLTNAGTFTGPLRVEAGTMKLTGALNIQSQPVEVVSGLLDLNGFSPRISSLSGAGGVGNSAFTAATLFLTNASFYGVIADGSSSVAVWAVGGSVGLYGNNTYSGGTVVTNDARVEITDSSMIGSGPLTLEGGTFMTSASRSVPLPNQVHFTTDSYITSSSYQSQVNLEFTSSSISGGAGKLQFFNQNWVVTNLFEPRFSGAFTFERPIVISNSDGHGKTRFVSGNTNGTTQIYSGAISGDGSFRRSVNGELGGVTILSASNSYSGTTLVDNGTLLVNGGLGTNTVTVTNLGILGGNGTVRGPVLVQNGGVLAPGTSIGRLTISNSLVFTGGSTAFMELNKDSLTNDFVTGLTSVTYGGTLSLTNLSGTLTSGSSFKLFSATSYSGAFTNIVPATPGTGLVWNTSGLLTNGTLRVASAPHIDSAVLSGTNLVVSGSSGITNGSYYVLTSTNAASPLTNWLFLLTNTFDGSGNFQFTNIVSPTTPQRYFLLQLP